MKKVFELCWHESGGSGLSMTWEQAMNMTADEAEFLLEMIGFRRKAEADNTKGKIRHTLGSRRR